MNVKGKVIKEKRGREGKAREKERGFSVLCPTRYKLLTNNIRYF